MLKRNKEICLKCEYQLKQKAISREKMLQLIKSVFLENEILIFQTLNLTLNA